MRKDVNYAASAVTARRAPAPIASPGFAVALNLAAIAALVPMGWPFYRLGLRALGRPLFRSAIQAAGSIFVVWLLWLLAREARRVGWLHCLGAAACMAAFGALLFSSPLTEELLHLFEFAPLAILLWLALPASWPPAARTIAAALLAGLAGVGDEGLQHLMPGRVFDWHDVLLDFLGAGLSLLFWRLVFPGEASGRGGEASSEPVPK